MATLSGFALCFVNSSDKMQWIILGAAFVSFAALLGNTFRGSFMRPFMELQFSAGALVSLLAVAAGCVFLQHFFRKKLGRDQYFYMRDLSLMSVMMLLALWSGSDRIEALVACSLLAMVVGLAEQARPGRGFFAFIL
ncbi:MAG: hypothetical protein IK035_05475, partial [Firmicutes bacterium]|nr:hypothetical protein [Bacillota bacterium]